MSDSDSDRRGGRKDPSELTTGDFANERMGRNSLQGNDQEDVRNQRHAVPDEKQDAEGVIESFENLDPETRADRERRAGRRE